MSPAESIGILKDHTDQESLALEVKNASGMVEAKPDETTPRYFNRETSWLAFNERVLSEVLNEKNPLMERVRFLGISDNNMDEFFMKRVGGLHRQLAAGVGRSSVDGRTPLEQLNEIRAICFRFDRMQRDIYFHHLLPQLKKAGIRIAKWDELNAKEHEILRDYYERHIYPILTPLGVGPGQPFPFISNLSMSLAVRMNAPGETKQRYARVKIPSNRPRWVRVEDTKTYITLEDLIAAHIDQLFVGMEIQEVSTFRVTRNADMERNEEEADDLLDVIEAELRNRKFAPIVRLETSLNFSKLLRDWLIEELNVNPRTDVFQSDAPLGMCDLMQLASQGELADHTFDSYKSVTHPRLADCERDSSARKNIFDVIREEDVLVHHPFQSFGTSVLAIIQQAALDPKVLAIKQTLYRTAPNSPIVAALLKACENGIEVNVTIEIKARFDEARNIEWVKTLEKAGAHVTYGFIGLKTHSKTLLIVRDEHDGIRRYAHIGTGNYHTGTARFYTDCGILTADPVLCRDVADLFNYLTGHSTFERYKKLLVAPVNMRQRFIGMIEREISKHTEEKPGRIMGKMNQLEDREIIEALYAASQKGVQIDLIVRGFNCLRPQVPGLSDNIRIYSVVGRFLEHSRIFYFQNGGDEEYYIGSADWMSRNLDWRVEAVAPVESPKLQKELAFLMKTYLSDHQQGWELGPDGVYTRRKPRRGKGSQAVLMDRELRNHI